MKKSLRFSWAAAAAFSGLLGATSLSALPVYVRVGPPAPIAEVRVVAPSPKHVWIAGYHRWDGAAYVWVPGRWVLPPRPRAVWVGGHWRHNRHGYYWVEGHWR